ncbi:MAG: DUF4340 domain-containing protein [Sandaracinaceae bacterium]
MLERRTTFVLVPIALVLLLAVWVFDRGSLTSSQLAERSGRVLDRFVRDEVVRLELRRGDEPPTVLERRREEEGEVGTWVLRQPVEGPADQDAVEGLLSALDFLMPERTLSHISTEDRRDFGLGEPRISVGFRAGRSEQRLLVGGDAPREGEVWVAIEGRDGAYTVAGDLVDDLDHDLAFFRERRLFVDAFPRDAVRIELRDGDERARFERTGQEGRWLLRAPEPAAWANRGLVDRLIRLVTEVRAERFAAEDAAHGLDAPERVLPLERPPDGAGEGPRRLLLEVGAPCEGHPDERYARAQGGPVVCLRGADLEALDIDAARLRERRLVTLRDDEIERIEVEADGASLTLARADGGWTVASTGGEPRAADPSAIEAWLRSLRAMAAVGFEPPGDGSAPERSTLRIRRTDVDEPLVLTASAGPRAGTIALRRGDEPSVAVFDAAVLADLRPDALRFRSRALVERRSGDARRVAIGRSDGTEEIAERGEGATWVLRAPVQVRADRALTQELVRRIAELRAERFVARSAAPEHGLDAPRLRVRVTFLAEEPPGGEEPTGGGEGPGDDASEQTVELSLGADVVEGAYARLGGRDAVFLLGPEAVDALEVHLASRDLLAASPDELVAIQVGESASLRRIEGEWRTEGGEPAPAAATRELLRALGGLRARRALGYEVDGLRAALRVELTPADGEPIALDLGAPSGDGDEAAVAIRRSDVPVLYEVPLAAARPILDYAAR